MKLNQFLLGSQRFQVKAPCVVALLASGQERYIYQDGVLPEDTRHSQIEMLLRNGMVVALEEAPS